jgi:hypothetical protein
MMVMGMDAVESTVEVAESEELTDIAGGDGFASMERPAGNIDTGDGEHEKGFEFPCLLGGLAEQSHGCSTLDGVLMVLDLMSGYMNADLGCIAGPLRAEEVVEGGR